MSKSGAFFLQMFSFNVVEKKNFFRSFCREPKIWKSFHARSSEYIRWCRTDQFTFNTFLYVILAEWGFVLSWRSTTFRLLTSAGHFHRRMVLSIHCSYWEYKSALSVFLWLKMNNTAVFPSYSQYNFTFVKLHLWGRPWRFILVNPLTFALNIVIKDSFFYLL